MALQQIVTVYINLKGDGSSTVFTFPISEMYVQSPSGASPYGSAGVVPTGVACNNPPVPVTSATIDTYGNITITLTSALGSGSVQQFEIDLSFNSGAATNASTVLVENVTIYSAGGTVSSCSPSNRLNVVTEATKTFVDTFDTTLDTTNNWAAPTSSGGGVAAATATGVLTLGTGTTANGYSYLQSNVNIPPTLLSYIVAQFVIKLENPIQTNTYRFWGFGTSPGAPTAAAPLTNAIGFELFTDQKLYAVVYAGGTRTVIQDFSSATGNSKQPADTNYHRYSIAWRSDKQFFMIDSTDAVGTGNFLFTQVQTLPIKLTAIANSTGPTASGVITCTSVGVGDSGCNNITISDATFGYRGMTVDSSGNAHVGVQSWGGTTLGAPQTLGSAPTGVVIGTSSDMYISGTRSRSNQTTTAAGVQDVNIVGSLGVTNSVTNATFTAITDNTTKVAVISATSALKTDMSSVAGTATATAAAGILKVGIVGNASAAFDQANGSAVPANGLLVGGGSVAGGTNFTTLTVKAASTAAVATDTSVVVQPLVGSHTMNTAAAGTQLVGIVGNAAATLDSTIGAATAPTNAVCVSSVYQTTIPALTAGQAVANQVDTTGAVFVNTESRRATYRASTSITPIAAAAQPLFVFKGSATKTIRITRLNVQVYCTTGTTLPATLTLVTYSSITGGTAVAVTKVPNDSGSAAASATVATYAGGLPTASTAVGNIYTGFLQWVTGGATVAQPTSSIDLAFGDRNGSAIVLRGTGQLLGFLLSSIGTTPVLAVTVEWVEDNS